MAKNKTLKRILKSDREEYYGGIHNLAEILAMPDDKFEQWSKDNKGRSRKYILKMIDKTLEACAAIDDYVEK